MRNIITRSLLWTAAIAAGYLAMGVAVSSFVFPPERVDYANYFQPGDKLASRYEGFDQTVLAVGDEWIHTRLEVRPHSPGPPEHFHEKFTETFVVKSGTLSIMIDGEKKTLQAGETVSIPPMTRHRPFNETAETVVVESPDPRTLPVEFAYHLTQLYGFMDRYPDGPPVPQMLMQLAVYGDAADSWIADGPPLGVQKAMRTLMAPTARLLGYKNYYPEYRPTHQ